jgi:hypothetical protein
MLKFLMLNFIKIYLKIYIFNYLFEVYIVEAKSELQTPVKINLRSRLGLVCHLK